ncbi:MAG TPA: hypothetical protein VI981_01380 [Candidatus Paceibacterota bacterium]
MKNIPVHIDPRTTTFRKINRKLVSGITAEHFEEQFTGRYVSPGVSVREYVAMMRAGDVLLESQTVIKLKDPVPDSFLNFC